MMISSKAHDESLSLLRRVAEALERLAPPPVGAINFEEAPGWIWQKETHSFQPIQTISGPELEDLQAITAQKKTLMHNTQAFAKGYLANNALLWGAKGMGKSSLVKAVFKALSPDFPRLKLVEVARQDLASLTHILEHVRRKDQRFILYCDDLSFDVGEADYKALKTVLEGGLAGRPENVVFYATSNRRHLLARQMIDNEAASAINPGEANEEKISLSDRFGLWLGFHHCSQDDYLQMIDHYARHVLGMEEVTDELRSDSLAWALMRGDRSGRVAWQFILQAIANQR
jgi:predicted AAA+ superfamily ATPase